MGISKLLLPPTVYQYMTLIHSCCIFVFFLQRILLYNAFATWRMCHAGFQVLDVFPITDSYPQGTGTHGGNGPVKNDIVHYSNLAFRPAEDVLERYFGPKGTSNKKTERIP